MHADDADMIRRCAKLAAAAGESLDEACPWPFDSVEGGYFKAEFIMHKAALIALGLDDKPLTTD